MPELISLSIDGQTVTVPAGATVAAAIAIHGPQLGATAGSADLASSAFPAAPALPAAATAHHAGTAPRPAIAQASGAVVTRRSVSGMLRGPLCGMGVCHECRVTIDGRAHQLACQTPCAPGMQVRTALAEDAA